MRNPPVDYTLIHRSCPHLVFLIHNKQKRHQQNLIRPCVDWSRFLVSRFEHRKSEKQKTFGREE
jgi:hypothetical protein